MISLEKIISDKTKSPLVNNFMYLDANINILHYKSISK